MNLRCQLDIWIVLPCLLMISFAVTYYSPQVYTEWVQQDQKEAAERERQRFKINASRFFPDEFMQWVTLQDAMKQLERDLRLMNAYPMANGVGGTIAVKRARLREMTLRSIESKAALLTLLKKYPE